MVEAVTYICGHSDVMMGVIVSKCPDWEQKTRSNQEMAETHQLDDLYLAQKG